MYGHFGRTRCRDPRHVAPYRWWLWAAVRRHSIKGDRDRIFDCTLFDTAISPVEREGSEHTLFAGCRPRRDDHISSFAWRKNKFGEALRIFLKPAVPANPCKHLSAQLDLEIPALR